MFTLIYLSGVIAAAAVSAIWTLRNRDKERYDRTHLLICAFLLAGGWGSLIVSAIYLRFGHKEFWHKDLFPAYERKRDEQAERENYEDYSDYVRSKGKEPLPFNEDWKRHATEVFAESFAEFINKPKVDESLN